MLRKRVISLLIALVVSAAAVPYQGLALENGEVSNVIVETQNGSDSGEQPDGTSAGNSEEEQPDGTPAGDSEEEQPDGTPAGDSEEKQPDGTPAGDSEEKQPDGTPAGDSEEEQPDGTPAGDPGEEQPGVRVPTFFSETGGDEKSAGPVTTEADLNAAITAAVDNQETTITLGATITLDAPLVIPAQKIIVLDLNGNTLTVKENKKNVIENSGTLTVKNGTVATVDAQQASEGFAVNNLAGANLTVAQDDGFTTKLIGRSGINNYAQVTVQNGTVESYNRNAYWGDPSSNLIVEDGTFTSPSGSSGMGRAISTEGNVTIHGGTFYAAGTSGAGDNYMNAIGVFYDGTLVIEPAEGKTVTVTSETDYAVSTMYGATVEIKGGTFACNGIRADIMDFEDNGGHVTISGGNFKHEPIAEYLAEGYVLVPTDKGYEATKAEDTAEVTVTSYEQLEAALNGQLTQPKNIILGANVQIPAGKVLTLKRGYTLDVPAGMTLTLDGVLTLDGTMTNEGTLTVGEKGFLANPLQLTSSGTITDFPVAENGVCRISTPCNSSGWRF